MTSSVDIISEQVLRIILSGNTNQDKELKKEDVRMYVNQALGTVLRTRFYQYKSEGEEYIDGSYIYTFDDVEVQKDTKHNKYYADLPAATIDLPNGVGIYSVGYMEDPETTFVPTPVAFPSLFKGLRSAALSKRTGFYKEGKKIFFVNMENGIPCKVMIKIVAPFGDLGKCNSFDIPTDLQEEVVQRAVQLFINTINIPKDNANDNIG